MEEKSISALQEVISAPILSKEVQANVVSSLVAQVTEGYVEPIQAFIKIKALAEIASAFLSAPEIVNLTTDAVDTYGKEAASYAGATVSVANTTRFDYSSCGDREYDELSRQSKDIANKLKAREMFLKAINDNLDTVDRATGEMYTIQPPTKKTTTSLRVLFAKA